MKANKTILVTGMPRSGTTWVGRMLSQGPSTRYVHEPFNISNQNCSCGVKFERWFTYLSSDNMNHYLKHLEHVIFPAFSWIGIQNLASDIMSIRRARLLGRYLRSYIDRNVIVKAPNAVFSAEQLALALDMSVVVVIRHPAAIASSYKKLNWSHPFEHFIFQESLMKEHLAPYRTEVEDFSRGEISLVEQAALLWKLIHSMIVKYQESHKDWIFVRHEDLAMDPVSGFQRIFHKLDLPISYKTVQEIKSLALRDQSSDSNDPYSIKRRSKSVIYGWKKELTSEEVYIIRECAGKIATHFYTDEDWEPD